MAKKGGDPAAAANAHFEAAEQLRLRGELPAAIARYRAALLRAVGEPAAAVVQYEAAIATAPRVAVLHFNLAATLDEHGHSLLLSVGLPELATGSVAEYVQAACTLASDQTRLAALRAGMRARLLVSPWLDQAGFTREWEEALSAMAAARCRPPSHEV